MATADEIKIRIIAKDEASRVFKQTQGNAADLKKAMFALKASIVAASVASGALLKSVIQTGASMESLKIRLRFLAGSTQNGAKAFNQLQKYASKVPFTFDEIANSAPPLLVVANNVGELNELLTITGDLAAFTGLSFQETALQLQRSFSAGIASAELFRERGVSAMLGFESGVSYSAEKTREIIVNSFRDGTSKAAGAAEALRGTFLSEVSMMQDAWMNLKLELANVGVLKEATNVVQSITDGIKDPAFQEGMKSFTTNMLDLFKFLVANKDVVMAIGAAWLGSKVGGVLGKMGQAAGALVGLGAFGASEIPFRFDMSKTDIQKLGYEELVEAEKKFNEELSRLYQVQDKLFYEGKKEDNVYKDAQRSIAIVREQIKYVEMLKRASAPYAGKVVPLGGQQFGTKEEQEQTIDYLANVAKGIDTWADSNKKLDKAIQSAAEKGMKSLEDAMVDMAMGAKSAKDAFKDMARSIVQDIMRIYIRKQLLGQVGAMGGGAGITSMFANGLNIGTAMEFGTNIGSQQTAMLAAQNLDFSGGGYTGSGARSGGMDGKGGFMAMLHPNETVIDHAAGQGMTQPVVVNFNINAIDTVTGSQFLAGNKPMIVGMIAEAMNRRGNRSTV